MMVVVFVWGSPGAHCQVHEGIFSREPVTSFACSFPGCLSS